MKVRLGKRFVGDGEPVYIIAEIGINHNGDLATARKLMAEAKTIGCDAVKFQKRTVEAVYTPEELAKPRENPFGPTNGDLKRGLEFGRDEYRAIDEYARKLGIDWFASCWDTGSVDFLEPFNPVCYKIASALITDEDLLRCHRATGRPVILSTGMSTIEQIDRAVDILGTENLIILHCTSTYPSKVEELNLRMIRTLHNRYDDVPVGYSGHEVGIPTSVSAVAMGACVIERHITLDRAMWGSDQAASVEVRGFERMVREIRAVEKALGDGVKRVYDSEVPIMQKLRKVGS